jgi:hypothetical protein
MKKIMLPDEFPKSVKEHFDANKDGQLFHSLCVNFVRYRNIKKFNNNIFYYAPRHALEGDLIFANCVTAERPIFSVGWSPALDVIRLTSFKPEPFAGPLGSNFKPEHYERVLKEYFAAFKEEIPLTEG